MKVSQTFLQEINHLHVIARKAITHENGMLSTAESFFRLVPDTSDVRIPVVLAKGRRDQYRTYI
jgi:hypothetical protein